MIDSKEGLRQIGGDRRELELFGKMLEGPWVGLPELGGAGVGEFLAESLLKVRGRDGKLHPLRANAMQSEFERRRGTGNIVLKARQMGMTTWVAGRMLLKTMCVPGTLTLLVAHTQESAQEILRIVHRYVDLMPAGLTKGLLRTAKRNVRELVFPKIDSEFRVESAANRNAGRGLTFQNLHCSEVSRWPDGAAEILAGLRAGLVPDGEQVLESTPNGVGGCFYEEWVRAGEVEGRGLVRHFFPWWLEPVYRAETPVDEGSLTKDELELRSRVGLDLRQVGFRRQLRANHAGMARQEYAEDAESCFRATGDPYFEMEGVERRLRELTEPIPWMNCGLEQCWEKYQGNLEVWWPPERGRRYLVAVDPAGGGPEGDWSVAEVVDLESGQQCAEYSSQVGGHELRDPVLHLAKDYGAAWVVVERNNHGSGLLSLLEEKRYERIYKGTDGKAGFLTNSISRPAILARLGSALVEKPELFYSRKLLVECRSFVRLPSGRLGARSGTHDDRVMAMAIGLEARREILGQQRVSCALRSSELAS